MCTTTEIEAKAIAEETELQAVKADLETTSLLMQLLTSNSVWVGSNG